MFQYELIYVVFGRNNFDRITANLDLFLRRFNEVQYWVVTEMCLTHSISKRVQLLRKFIKVAAWQVNTLHNTAAFRRLDVYLHNESLKYNSVCVIVS